MSNPLDKLFVYGDEAQALRDEQDKPNLKKRWLPIREAAIAVKYSESSLLAWVNAKHVQSRREPTRYHTEVYMPDVKAFIRSKRK
jgi:hypothetical protein